MRWKKHAGKCLSSLCFVPSFEVKNKSLYIHLQCLAVPLCKQPINSSSVIVSYHAHPAGLSPLLSNLGSVSDTSLKRLVDLSGSHWETLLMRCKQAMRLLLFKSVKKNLKNCNEIIYITLKLALSPAKTTHEAYSAPYLLTARS